MDADRETQEIFLSIQRAATWMDPFLKLTTMGGILLVQYFARMVTEKKLRAGVFQDFQQFIKLTDGEYDIMNVPAVDTSQISAELHDLGVRHMVLPDLDKEDGMLQVAVYQPDRDKFGAWYQRYILSEMQGGEREVRDLRNLTAGRTSILSLPVEALDVEWKEDFKAMGVNYASLPDLRVGDGQIQIIVANSDLPQVEQWYQLKREDLKKEGITLEDYSTISMTEYSQTGQMSEQSYMESASTDYQEANQKYEGREKGEVENAVKENQKIKEENAVSFEQYENDPDYIPLSIDRTTLVEQASRNLQDFWKEGNFACRIPGTWGNREYLLLLPLQQVFVQKERDAYLAFINKNSPPTVIHSETGEAMQGVKKMTGRTFAKTYFDPVVSPSAERKRDWVDVDRGQDRSPERMDLYLKKEKKQPDVSIHYKPDPGKPERIIPPPVLKK